MSSVNYVFLGFSAFKWNYFKETREFTALELDIELLWFSTLCSLVRDNRRFGEAWYFSLIQDTITHTTQPTYEVQSVQSVRHRRYS